MEGTSTSDPPPITINHESPTAVTNPTATFKYPTPTLRYLADTKQTDLYTSLNINRERKVLLLGGVRGAHKDKLSQNTAWRDVSDDDKKAAMSCFFQNMKDKEELTLWLREFQDDWLLSYLFRKRHAAYLDSLRRHKEERSAKLEEGVESAG